MKLPKLDWQQVIALTVLVAGAITFAALAPEEYHAPVIGLFVAAAGWLRAPHTPRGE